LGGGNHFIELQRNEKDNLCIMLHSGSRNIGYKTCDLYSKIAKEFNEKYNPEIDPKWNLASLPIDSKEGIEYIKAMNFCMEFAKQNRFLMMERIKNITFNLIKKYTSINNLSNIEIGLEVNIHHNYANLENHFGKDVWIHRKGATSALKDQLGIIPGSMGTSSYIVKGLGNENSFKSCSHGAGRVMGRNDASRRLTKTQCDKDMEGIVFKGWTKHSTKKMKGKTDLGEAPRAYKDIDMVIESQLDLIEPIMKLKPIGVVKE
jgi:tRNA-splicing ligase RtcB